MLRVAVILGLLVISLAYVAQKDWSKNNEDHSWEERRGYEDCEDFILLRRDNFDKDGDNHQPQDCPPPKPLDEICAVIECPKFEKINTTGCGYEARKFFGAHWVGSPVNVSDLNKSYVEAYTRLQQYFNGANEQGVELAVTAPLMGEWVLDKKQQLKSGVLIFYIPAKYQSNPPVPKDEHVAIGTQQDFVLYDRAFGCRDPDMYTQEFKLLWEAMMKQKITPYPSSSFTAEWTRPGTGGQRIEVALLENHPHDYNGFM